jgi:hypothetical protein
MLDDLLRLVDQIGQQFQFLLMSHIGDEDVRGAILDVDEYWINAAKSDLSKNFGVFDSRQLRMYHGAKIDTSYRPADWQSHCEAMGYQSESEPFIIRVIVTKPDVIHPGLPRQFQTLPIRYEPRQECRALVEFGSVLRLIRNVAGASRNLRAVSVGRSDPNTAGTMGGVPKCVDTSGLYIVSCAHVLGDFVNTEVQSPGPYEGRHSRQIGRVVCAQLPPRKLAFQRCNIDAAPNAARLDCAIAALDSTGTEWLNSLGLQPVHHTRRAAQMDRSDPVFFVGKESGRVDATLGGVTIWDTIQFADGPRCFSRIFEMRYPRHEYVNSPLAKPGDSGAWVFSEIDNLLSWDGMLIAGDEKSAYGCFSEAILNENRGILMPNGVELMTGFGGRSST